MLDATMATPKKTTKAPAKGKAPTARGKASKPKVAPLTFAEAGRAAAREAQRAILLETWERCGWNLTATAEALAMGAGSNVTRALKTLAPEEHEAAKRDGRISPTNHRES